MELVRPPQLRAGFHAYLHNSGVAGLVHAGDQHAPSSWLIGQHQHQVWEFYLQVEGPTTRWQVADTDYPVPARGLLAVPPRVVHQMLEPATDSYHFYFAALDTDRLLEAEPDLREDWRTATTFAVPDASALLPAFDVFLREVTTSQPYRGAGLRYAAVHLLIQATRLLMPASHRRSLAVHPAVAEACRILETDLSARPTLADLAVGVNLSPTYVQQLFTAQMGQSPSRYQNQLRLRRAEVLLAETDQTITRIATELGYSSPQHFATDFRHHTGSSPRNFRRRLLHMSS
ncbi:MAG: helix-turn-helix transcriptional regulator [Nocardioidaceae bacterium]